MTKKFELVTRILVEAEDLQHARYFLDKELWFVSQHNSEHFPIVTYDIDPDGDEILQEQEDDR